MGIEVVLAAVGTAAAVVQAVTQLEQVLNGARSVILHVENQTNTPLTLVPGSDHHLHGGFAEPPDRTIPPNTALLFSSQSIGGSLFTGTEGVCSFAGDGIRFDVYWDNPFSGSNSCDLKYSGDQAARYMVDHACGVGNTGAHNKYFITNRALANFRAHHYIGNPALIQSRFDASAGHGNFELLVPVESGGMAAYFRRNNAPGLPWEQSALFGEAVGRVDGVSMIQSNIGDPGNLEVIARVGDRLVFFWRDSGPAFQWSGPFDLIADGNPVRGVTGNPVLIQSTFGRQGNFELLTPLTNGGLGHFWRDNDAADRPWHGPGVIASGLRADAVAMIESSFGPGNLEVIAQSAQQLQFMWRSNADDNFQWHGPFGMSLDTIGGGGNLALIQSRFGTKGNFELVGIESKLGGTGPVWQEFRNNDDPSFPWKLAPEIEVLNDPQALTMIQSDFDSPGNLELITRQRDGTLAFCWRDSGPGFRWNGPFIM